MALLRVGIMLNEGLIFENPPASKKKRGIIVRRLRLIASRPNEWARWPTKGSVLQIVGRKTAELADLDGTFEAVMRGGQDNQQTWVRFVPNKKA